MELICSISSMPSCPCAKLVRLQSASSVRTRRTSTDISQKQITQIAKSIGQFGFIAPIVTDEDSCILAGHGRWLAASELGLKRVPVLVVSGLSDAERRAYLLADNKLTENAGWDRSALATELHQLAPLLAETGLEIGLTGFETPEIDALMADLIDPEQDPADEVFELAKEPISRRGDLWLLDRHRLLCGDAKDDHDLDRLMGRKQATIVFADPALRTTITLATTTYHTLVLLVWLAGSSDFLWLCCQKLLAISIGSIFTSFHQAISLRA
jgi:ParB-like chromosome segregation protein Spo0J